LKTVSDLPCPAALTLQNPGEPWGAFIDAERINEVFGPEMTNSQHNILKEVEDGLNAF
jgi:hypothetical protein